MCGEMQKSGMRCGVAEPLHRDLAPYIDIAVMEQRFQSTDLLARAGQAAVRIAKCGQRQRGVWLCVMRCHNAEHIRGGQISYAVIVDYVAKRSIRESAAQRMKR